MTKVNEKAVMMMVNPLMLDVDIVPRGLDTPGIADGVGAAIASSYRRVRRETEKSTSCVSRLRYSRGRGGRSNEAHCVNFRIGKVQQEPG